MFHLYYNSYAFDKVRQIIIARKRWALCVSFFSGFLLVIQKIQITLPEHVNIFNLQWNQLTLNTLELL
jgi:hypothetical protein